MKVFIENEAGSTIKNLFDEKTLKFKKTMVVSAAYPYPYGFVLDTTSGDGDNLDCFILTDTKLKTGQTVECTPIACMEQFETSWDPQKAGAEEEDHKILAVLEGENVEVNEDIKNRLSDFVGAVFSHIPNKKVRVGKFLGAEMAEDLLRASHD